MNEQGDLKQESFDYVILTMASTALRGEWFKPFIDACADAQIVCLQPAIEDVEYIKQFVPEERFCKGLIQFLSYQPPLPGTKSRLACII